MKKYLLALALVLAVSVSAQAQDALRFAVVPKVLNIPWFATIEEGCKARAEELGVECMFVGPTEPDPALQAQVVYDLLSQDIDGLAIAPTDAVVGAKLIAAANDKGIPVVTFDNDAPDSNRDAFIGSDNKAMGVGIGTLLREAQPEGGKYAIISGSPASVSHGLRVEGIREALEGSDWIEVSGSPTFSQDDFALSIQQMNDLMTANPDLSAIVSIATWPMSVPEAFEKFVEQYPEVTIVSGDTDEIPLQLLRRGLALGLVGQRPYEMGVKTIESLLALSKGEEVPEIVNTDLDTVTSEDTAKIDELLAQF